MPRGVASAEQLAMMEKVLETYCRTNNITNAADRDELAAVILALFDRGFRDEDSLQAELVRRDLP